MLKKQSPGTPLSKSQKRRKNRRAASEAEEEENDSDIPPRKRACTTGIPRPTLRGLVVGSRLIEATQTLTPCIVFGDEFSSWLSCLGELGFRATALVLESPMFVDLARSLVDTSCQIHVGIDSKFSNTSLQIAFIDG
eukprot:scaffold61805_cov35-Attheya_sp.AAC.1